MQLSGITKLQYLSRAIISTSLRSAKQSNRSFTVENLCVHHALREENLYNNAEYSDNENLFSPSPSVVLSTYIVLISMFFTKPQMLMIQCSSNISSNLYLTCMVLLNKCMRILEVLY